jgi:O-antigen/teichoic acid export membrane protein
MVFLQRILSNNIIKNIMSMGAATLISAALAFFVGIFTRNILGPEKYGYWLTISLIFTFIPFFQFGIINAMNREVPYYIARNDFQRVRDIKNLTLSFIFTIPLIIAFILALVSVFLLFLDLNYEYKIGIIYSSFLVILLLLSAYVEMFYKSEQNFKTASILISTKNITQSILTVLFVYLFGYQGLFIGMSVALIIQLVFGRASLKNFEYKFDINQYKELIKIGFPIFLVGIVWTILIASDRVIISIFMSPEDLGIYGVGMLIFNSMMLLPQVIGQVLYPKIVELVSKEKYKEIYNLFWKTNSTLAIVMGIIVTFLFFVFPWFIENYMPDYKAGILTGQILLLGIFPLTLMGFSANYFNAAQRQSVYIGIQILTIVINIVLSFLFLSIEYKVSSVALGTSTSYLIYFFLMNYFFLREIKKFKIKV